MAEEEGAAAAEGGAALLHRETSTVALPCPGMGPEPTILNRKEVDTLYDILEAVTGALKQLGVRYIVTGGSLLGAVRQHSILFCDDDIDIAIIEESAQGGTETYDRVSGHLAALLGKDYSYTIRPWEGGDKVRSKKLPAVFLDLFVLRRYAEVDELVEVLKEKKNGKLQREEYVQGIITKMQESAFSQGESRPMCPFWHFSTRKAVELWPKEVYRESELFPLTEQLKMGPLDGIHGPRMPVLLLRRAFGLDCFDIYYQSCSHKTQPGAPKDRSVKAAGREGQICGPAEELELPPVVLGGGTWEGSTMAPLEDRHFVPMQPQARVKRRPTLHGRQQLLQYLSAQGELEESWLREEAEAQSRPGNGTGSTSRPRCTVYMDGVFDLFHVGHLEAIRQCAALGDRVIIGVTGDADAAGYKRPPIISEADRTAIIGALRDVDAVVCPCPLVVTEDFMEQHSIDLVVHGFANDADAKKQEQFFEVPLRLGKFQRIEYYSGLNTTEIINRIRSMTSS